MIDYWKKRLHPEANRFFLWGPVIFGMGISGYFLWPFEPTLMGVGVVWTISASLAFLSLKIRRSWICLWIIVFLSVSGFSCITLRTSLIGTVLVQDAQWIRLEKAYIESMVQRASGWHADVVIEKFTPYNIGHQKARRGIKEKTQERAFKKTWVGYFKKPHSYGVGGTPSARNLKIRVFMKSMPPFVQGNSITGGMHIMPLPEANCFGGFSLRRQAYYSKLAGYGFFKGRPTVDLTRKQANKESFFSRKRQAITHHLKEALSPVQSAIGEALITGNRYGIPQKLVDDFSISGLSHVLAISGLHMSLIAALIFFVIQRVLNVSRSVYVVVYGPKLLVFLTGGASFMYLGLSGFSLSALRAFLMTCLVLLAFLRYGWVISLRSVAIAAWAILICLPESLMNPSFSLSFAAVTGLIGGYETIKMPVFLKKELHRSKVVKRFFYKILGYGSGIFVSSCIASISTLPLLLFYFHTFSAQGLVSNFIGIPLVAFWILPWGFLGTLVCPIGLHIYPYKLMGLGIDLLVFFIQVMAKIPGMTVVVPHPPDGFLIGSVLGGAWFIIWKTPWRRVGLLGPCVGVFLWIFQTYPTLIIIPDVCMIGFKDKSTLWVGDFSKIQPTTFKKTPGSSERILDQWKRALGCTNVKPLKVCGSQNSQDPCYRLSQISSPKPIKSPSR